MKKKSFISSFLIVGLLAASNVSYGEIVTNASISNNSPSLQQIVASYNQRFAQQKGDLLLGYNKQSKANEDINVRKIIDRLAQDSYLPVDRQYLNYTSRFGRRGTLASESTPVESIAIHTGLDIAAANIENSNAYNVLDGKVEKVSYSNAGYGNHVIVDHGDFRTYYAHLNAIEPLVEGQPIKGGELIGKVGNTGRSTGPHLHFEINIGYTALDPEVFMPYIRKTAKVIAEVDKTVDLSKKLIAEDKPLAKPTRANSLLPKQDVKVEKKPEVKVEIKKEKAYELTLDPPVVEKQAVPFDFSKPKSAYSFEFDFQ